MKTKMEHLFAPGGTNADSEPAQASVQNDKPASVYNSNFLFNLIYKFAHDKVGNQ